MTKLVTIAGVGALGSHTVQLIRNEEVKIKCIDFDHVERKNVLSQFHGKAAVGKNKAQALKQSINFLFGTKVEAVPHKITKDNVEQLLGESNLVIDCLDNAKSRKLIQDFVRKEHIPCVHGALAADGLFGQVIWDENFTIDLEPGNGTPTCEDGEHLAFIAIVSSYLSQAVHMFLSNTKKMGFQVNPNGAIRT